MIVDQSHWGLVAVSGSDRMRFLHGLCTGNVLRLEIGSWFRTSMLNAKGRVVSVFDVINRGPELLLICEWSLRDKTDGLLHKFAIADDVDVRPTQLEVYRVWDSPQAVWHAPPIFGSPPDRGASESEVEVRRIEAGLPKYDVDVGEANFPFETPLAKLIDYEKGCYIGQEPIARVHARGSANKLLVGLRVAGDGEIAVGEQVEHSSRANAGTVMSAAMSPDFGPIALAYLHKGLWEPGTEVRVAKRAAIVAELPFARSG